MLVLFVLKNFHSRDMAANFQRVIGGIIIPFFPLPYPSFPLLCSLSLFHMHFFTNLQELILDL